MASSNNCNIFTVFPLGLSYTSTDATSAVNDGTINLFISGGTTPYSIVWSTGDVGVTQFNDLVAGDYEVTVVDKYGDYSATTTITIGAPAPTPSASPTPTPTPTPAPSYPSTVCLTMNQSPNTQYEFDYQGIINSRPSWSGSSYNVVYDYNNSRWYLSGFTGSNLVQNSTVTIPTGTWNQLGTSNNWTMATGSCVTVSLDATVSTTPTTCNGTDNGTLSINAWGGTGPLVYSIDGVTYQSSSTFLNLPSGNGTVYIKDAVNNVITRNFSVTNGSNPTVYTVTLSTTTTTLSNSNFNKSKSVSWVVSVSPSLPSGVSITTDIRVQNYFTNFYYGSQNATFTSGSTISANGSSVVNSTTKTLNTSSGMRACGGGLVDGYELSGHVTTYNVTVSGGTVTGTDSFTVTNPIPEYQPCPVYGQNYFSIELSNMTLNGTNCGTVTSIGSGSESVSTSPFPN